jgi:hypothetical protein
LAVAVVIGGLIAVLQSGYPVTSAVLGDGSAFLANGTTVVHVNGESGRSDAQLSGHLAKSGEGLSVAGLPNGQLAVVNDATDVLTTVDGTTMGITGTVRPGQSKPGSVRVVAADPNRWWIDIAAGDVALLGASGNATPAVSVGGPIIDTAPGSEGSLLLLTADGTVTRIDSHLQPTAIPVTGGRGGSLAFASGATFLVSAGGSVLALAGDQPRTIATVPGVGPGPDGHVDAGSTASPADHVLIIAGDSLIVLDVATGRSQASALPSGSAMLGRPVELNGRAYIPDYAHHCLLVVNETTGALGAAIPVPGTAKTFALFVFGHRVWANDQYNQFALVIDNNGDSRLVNKGTDSNTPHPTTTSLTPTPTPTPTPSKQATSQPRTPSPSPAPQRSSGPRPNTSSPTRPQLPPPSPPAPPTTTSSGPPAEQNAQLGNYQNADGTTAQANCQAAGFSCTVAVGDPPIGHPQDAGKVERQSHGPGTYPAGTQVTLYVWAWSGEVPNVTTLSTAGEQASPACQTLVRAGFQCALSAAPARNANIAVGQNPQPSIQPLGTVVTVYYSPAQVRKLIAYGHAEGDPRHGDPSSLVLFEGDPVPSGYTPSWTLGWAYRAGNNIPGTRQINKFTCTASESKCQGYSPNRLYLPISDINTIRRTYGHAWDGPKPLGDFLISNVDGNGDSYCTVPGTIMLYTNESISGGGDFHMYLVTELSYYDREGIPLGCVWES